MLVILYASETWAMTGKIEDILKSYDRRKEFLDT